jgi:hypothetical protein
MTEVPGIVQYRSQPLALRRLEILDTTTVSQFAALVRNG